VREGGAAATETITTTTTTRSTTRTKALRKVLLDRSTAGASNCAVVFEIWFDGKCIRWLPSWRHSSNQPPDQALSVLYIRGPALGTNL